MSHPLRLYFDPQISGPSQAFLAMWANFTGDITNDDSIDGFLVSLVFTRSLCYESQIDKDDLRKGL